MAYKLYFRSLIDSISGTGQLNIRLIRSLLKQNVNVQIVPIIVDKRCPIPPDIEERIIPPPKGAYKFLFRWNSFLKGDVKICTNSAAFLVYDATRLDSQIIRNINQFTVLIVSSEWNAVTYSALGVNIPIHKIPHCIDTSKFTYKAPILKNKLIYGAISKLDTQKERKNFEFLVDCFTTVFKPNQDVELQLKIIHPDRSIETQLQKSPLIKIFNETWNEDQLIKWYQNIDFLIHLSRAEGFGLTPLEALAIGRPVIAPIAYGLKEYLSPEFMIPVEFYYEYIKSSPYEGHWLKISKESVCAALLETYENPKKYFEKVKKFAKYLPIYSINAVGEQLHKILKKYEIYEIE